MDESCELNVCCFVEGKFYLSSHRKRHVDDDRCYFELPDYLEYSPFCDDFGPLSFSSIVRFIELLDKLIETFPEKKIYYLVEHGRRQITNGAFLFGVYGIMKLDLEPLAIDEIFKKAKCFTFEPYRDATFAPVDFGLSLLDCWKAVARAKVMGWFRLPTTSPTLWGLIEIGEYEYLEDPLNGDLVQVIPGKFVAFKGPIDLGGRLHRDMDGYRKFGPEHYLKIFRCLRVKTVVRLNQVHYDEAIFSSQGIRVVDLQFDDCTAPPGPVVAAFIKAVDESNGLVAVHCLAGLGRTGTLIAIYMMKAWRFSAREAIAWLRIMRPGSVIGEQQQYLCDMEEALEDFRLHCSNSTVCLEVKKSPAEGIGGADRRKLAAALAGQVSAASQRRACCTALPPSHEEPHPPHSQDKATQFFSQAESLSPEILSQMPKERSSESLCEPGSPSLCILSSGNTICGLGAHGPPARRVLAPPPDEASVISPACNLTHVQGLSLSDTQPASLALSDTPRLRASRTLPYKRLSPPPSPPSILQSHSSVASSPRSGSDISRSPSPHARALSSTSTCPTTGKSIRPRIVIAASGAAHAAVSVLRSFETVFRRCRSKSPSRQRVDHDEATIGATSPAPISQPTTRSLLQQCPMPPSKSLVNPTATEKGGSRSRSQEPPAIRSPGVVASSSAPRRASLVGDSTVQLGGNARSVEAETRSIHRDRTRRQLPPLVTQASPLSASATATKRLGTVTTCAASIGSLGPSSRLHTSINIDKQGHSGGESSSSENGSPTSSLPSPGITSPKSFRPAALEDCRLASMTVSTCTGSLAASPNSPPIEVRGHQASAAIKSPPRLLSDRISGHGRFFQS